MASAAGAPSLARVVINDVCRSVWCQNGQVDVNTEGFEVKSRLVKSTGEASFNLDFTRRRRWLS